jgi:acetamidase/formamidase
VFDAAREPVLRIRPGDTVVVETLDASGYLEPQTFPGEARPRMHPGGRGHCLTGPIAIEGVRAGDVVGIHIDDVAPGRWGWTAAGGKDTPILRRLGLDAVPTAWLLWEITSGRAVERRLGIERRVAPFPGVVGLAPADPGEHSTIPPRPGVGGNLDCRELVAGATLYLTAAVEDGLLFLGDAHAAQGDGEVGGTAIECPATLTVTVHLPGPRPVPGLHAETPVGLVTLGLGPDLDSAAGEALDAMVSWLARRYDVERATALALASSGVDLRVTQVANRTWGVHAVLSEP